jgi:N-acetylglucosamine-6-phosphate deacetylase
VIGFAITYTQKEMLRTLTGRRLITPIGTVEYPVIAVDAAGMIAEIFSDPANGADSVSGEVLTPAFLDVHTHGCAGHDVMEGTWGAFEAIGRFLAGKGVGRFLATTVTAPVEKTLRSLEGMADAIEAGEQTGRAVPIGVHLEGPFISHAKRGVHPEEDIQRPSVDLFERFQGAARGHIRLVTIAPEMPGALELIRHCVATGVRVSVGHSNGLSSDALAAVEAGASSATHTFNAMRALGHREPGILGTVLDNDALFAELICDGIHVAPEMVRLWLKAKGGDKAILVTDSISATGMPDGEYMLGTFKVTVADGRCYATDDLAKDAHTLAGSVLTMDRAVANLRRFGGASLAIAVRLASSNPARMLGLETAVVPGEPASFNCFSADGELRATVLRGVGVSD